MLDKTKQKGLQYLYTQKRKIVNTMIEILERKKVYTTQQLRDNGFNAYDCRKLMKNNQLAALKRGHYVRSDHQLDSISLVVETFPEATFILQSALYLHGYLYRTPRVIIGAKKSESRMKYHSDYIPMKVLYRDDKYADLGVMKMSYHGRILKVSDPERTLIDCIRRQDLITFEEYNCAVRAYIQDPNKDLDRLLRYAEILHVESKVLMILQPWMKFEGYTKRTLQPVIQ